MSEQRMHQRAQSARLCFVLAAVLLAELAVLVPIVRYDPITQGETLVFVLLPAVLAATSGSTAKIGGGRWWELNACALLALTPLALAWAGLTWIYSSVGGPASQQEGRAEALLFLGTVPVATALTFIGGLTLRTIPKGAERDPPHEAHATLWQKLALAIPLLPVVLVGAQYVKGDEPPFASFPSVSLHAVPAGDAMTLIATADRDLSGTDLQITIFAEEGAASMNPSFAIFRCEAAGAMCSYTPAHRIPGIWTFTAAITRNDTVGPRIATSSPVTISWVEPAPSP